MEIRVQHHSLAFRREDQENRDCVLVKQEFGILPVVHVEKLGIMHAIVGVLACNLSHHAILLFVSLSQLIYVAWQVPVSYTYSSYAYYYPVAL